MQTGPTYRLLHVLWLSSRTAHAPHQTSLQRPASTVLSIECDLFLGWGSFGSSIVLWVPEAWLDATMCV